MYIKEREEKGRRRKEGVVAKSSYHCASHRQARRMVAQSFTRVREGGLCNFFCLTDVKKKKKLFLPLLLLSFIYSFKVIENLYHMIFIQFSIEEFY